MFSDINDFRTVFPFFDDMTESEGQDFMRLLSLSHLKAGETMLQAGQQCTGIGFILSGAVRLYRLSEDGREITLYHIRKGEVCVLTAACFLGRGSIDYPIGAIAQTDAKIAMLGFDAFRRLFYQSKALQEFIFNALAKRLFNVMEVVDVVAFKSINERLIDYLLASSNDAKHAIYSTHAEIARDIGTAREVVSRSLKNFEKKGYIRLTRGRIDILDKPALIGSIKAD